MQTPLALVADDLILLDRGCSLVRVAKLFETLHAVIANETLNISAIIDLGCLFFLLHACEHLDHFLEVYLTMLVFKLLQN